MNPLASIIIPVYNGGAFLAPTIESCLNQDQKNIEIIIVDDGSTDRTPKIIEHYQAKDSRIVSCRLPENRGRSEARNYGIYEAKSPILLMMDADDIATPNRVSDTLKFFKKNPGTSICYGQFSVIDAYGKIMGHQDAQPFDKKKVIKDKMFYIGHSTMAFRRKVAEKVSYTSGEYSKHGIDDWKFQLDAMNKGFRFGPVKRMFMQYRWIPKERDEKRILELKEAALA
jgi:glycosyltransferase involved in cell wall biosynthesis